MSARISPLFPPSEGDFILKSSDKVLFHVHRILLCLSSSVFRDAFEIWTREANPPAYSEKKAARSSSLEPATAVEVSEDSNTMECLLSFVYPNVPQPKLKSLDSLRLVLQAAQKYGMPRVLNQAAALLIARQDPDDVSEPFYKSNPLKVYAIARDLGLKQHAKLAAQESLRIRLNTADSSNELDDMPTKYYRELLGLRKERKAWLKNGRWWVMSTTVTSGRGNAPHSSCHCASKQCRDIPHEIKRTLLKSPSVDTIRGLDLAHHFPCLRCLGVAHTHFTKMAVAFEARFPSYFAQITTPKHKFSNTMASRYIWPLFSATLFTSFMMHLANHRQNIKADQIRVQTQISMLERCIERVKAGEKITDEEIHRLKRTAGFYTSPTATSSGKNSTT